MMDHDDWLGKSMIDHDEWWIMIDDKRWIMMDGDDVLLKVNNYEWWWYMMEVT